MKSKQNKLYFGIKNDKEIRYDNYVKYASKRTQHELIEYVCVLLYNVYLVKYASGWWIEYIVN